jgi:hypothetical protein
VGAESVPNHDIPSAEVKAESVGDMQAAHGQRGDFGVVILAGWLHPSVSHSVAWRVFFSGQIQELHTRPSVVGLTIPLDQGLAELVQDRAACCSMPLTRPISIRPLRGLVRSVWSSW